MNDKLSLNELQLIIRDSIYMALPEMYWVIAEISEIKENYAGHCYLELIEKNPDEKYIKARAKAIIWSTRYRFLKSFFENSTGESLRDGLKILIKVRVEYHELYGLSLMISDIDPTFTIGEMAMKRRQVITKLEQEGVFSMNKELELPLLPQKIAVISSKNAAGYSDFINQLKENSFGYAFHTVLIESVMQGTETEKGIINALGIIAENSSQFDIVVIIRGGGSQSDLSFFDNYDIAYYVTQFPMPVITGIGHEKDLSVTDMVANIALKTPTAVADYLINHFVQTENIIIEMSSEIRNMTQVIIENSRTRIEKCQSELIPLVRDLLAQIKNKISLKTIEIIDIGKEYIFRAWLYPAGHKSRLASAVRSFSNEKKSFLESKKQRITTGTKNLLERNKILLSGYENSLNILEPGNVLRRGYTITSLNGRIQKKSFGLKVGDAIDTKFSDGSATSKVIEKTGN